MATYAQAFGKVTSVGPEAKDATIDVGTWQFVATADGSPFPFGVGALVQVVTEGGKIVLVSSLEGVSVIPRKPVSPA